MTANTKPKRIGSSERRAAARSPTGIAKSVRIKAPPSKVFGAVSTREGMRGWWCRDTSGSDSKGGRLNLEFGGGHAAQISLAKTDEPRYVEWDVLGHRVWSEWRGTRLYFELEPDEKGGTRVHFRHGELDPKCECYGPCSGAWAYLMGSLKDFLEQGKGGPV